MKKVMFAAAVAAAGGLMAIESANVVGYQGIPRYSTYTFAGSMFTQPGQSYYILNNVKIASISDAGTDFIQFFKPGTTTLDRDQSYYFDGEDWCYRYDATADGDGDWEQDDVIPDNFQVPVNIGFLTRFTTAKSANAVITYSGEVQQGSNNEVKVDRVSAYQIVVNPLPRAVDLTELKVESASDAGTDFIQFFKPGTTTLDRDQSYYYDGEDWCYRYDATSDGNGDWEQDDPVAAGTCTIRPGEGFLIRFTTAKAANAKIVFPSPTATTPAP